MPSGSGECFDVAVLAPTGRDNELVEALLKQQGLVARSMSSGEQLADAVEAGLGAALITEEALTAQAVAALVKMLALQPPWADFPFIVMSGHLVSPGARPVDALSASGNVTMLDRPVQT